MFGDVTKEEFVVFSHHLADVAEASRRAESVGEYGTHDLVMLEDGSVGMVVGREGRRRADDDTGGPPDVRPARLHDMRRKVNTRGPARWTGPWRRSRWEAWRASPRAGQGHDHHRRAHLKGVLWGKARDA